MGGLLSPMPCHSSIAVTPLVTLAGIGSRSPWVPWVLCGPQLESYLICRVPPRIWATKSSSLGSRLALPEQHTREETKGSGAPRLSSAEASQHVRVGVRVELRSPGFSLPSQDQAVNQWLQPGWGLLFSEVVYLSVTKTTISHQPGSQDSCPPQPLYLWSLFQLQVPQYLHA